MSDISARIDKLISRDQRESLRRNSLDLAVPQSGFETDLNRMASVVLHLLAVLDKLEEEKEKP